jgi:uncharacterized membrane protein YccC
MRIRFLVAILAALALGVAGGYLYRRWRAPSLEERVRDAAHDLRRRIEKLTR